METSATIRKSGFDQLLQQSETLVTKKQVHVTRSDLFDDDNGCSDNGCSDNDDGNLSLFGIFRFKTPQNHLDLEGYFYTKNPHIPPDLLTTGGKLSLLNPGPPEFLLSTVKYFLQIRVVFWRPKRQTNVGPRLQIWEFCKSGCQIRHPNRALKTPYAGSIHHNSHCLITPLVLHNPMRIRVKLFWDC